MPPVPWYPIQNAELPRERLFLELFDLCLLKSVEILTTQHVNDLRKNAELPKDSLHIFLAVYLEGRGNTDSAE